MALRDVTKLRISGISLLPLLLTLGIVMVVVYSNTKQTLLGKVWKDLLLWFGSTCAFFGASLSLMYIPWPAINNAESSRAQ